MYTGIVGVGVVRDTVDHNRFNRDMAANIGIDTYDSRRCPNHKEYLQTTVK